MTNEIEAILGSPPERDELVIQLFARNGGQWGEVFREGDTFYLDLYCGEGGAAMRFRLEDLRIALEKSEKVLRERLVS